MTSLFDRTVLALLTLVFTACAPVGPPKRSSPELIEVEASPAPIVPRWEEAEGGEGWAIPDAQGELTARAPDALVFGPHRSFDDGTVLVCGTGTLGRWADGAWTLVPLPDLPDLRPRGDDPRECNTFDAWSVDEAVFVLGSGHLCGYDGTDVTCVDATSTVALDPDFGASSRGIRVAGEHAFLWNQSAHWSTELFVIARGAPPGSVREIGSTGGNIRAVKPVPGVDQIVVDQSGESTDWSPRVFGVEGLERVLDVDRELADDYGSLSTDYETVPITADHFFVVIYRDQWTRQECTGSEDDPMCEILEWWSELVVLENGDDGAMVEVAHLTYPNSTPGTNPRAVRVGNELRIETLLGWLAIP